MSEENDKNSIKVLGKMSLDRFTPDAEYFLCHSYSLRGTRNFTQFKFKGVQSSEAFACRNFILKFSGKVLQFRVFFRFHVIGRDGRGTQANPQGILSFDGDSKPVFSRFKALKEDGKLITNFGLGENGFRHLIAYCRSVFGHDFTLLDGETRVEFYQSPILYRPIPQYVWHVIELITFGNEISKEIKDYARQNPSFLTTYMDADEKKLLS